MFRLHRNPRNTIVPVAGTRVSSRLINAVQSNYVTLVARGTLTVAVADLTNIRNRGSIWAAFTEVGLSENGKDRQLLDGKALRYMAEMAAPSALTARRVTAVTIGVYTLEEAVRIYFAHPFAAVPRETAFLERDSKQVLEVFATLDVGGGGSKLGTVGAGTCVLTNPSITVTHGYDATETAKPYFIPTVRQIVQNVDAASTQLETFIKTSNALRGMIVSQEGATIGEVGDIINSLTLRGDFGEIIGPAKMDMDDLILESEFEFGGAVLSSNRAHLGLNFQSHGRLASVLSPQQDNNLRFEFDCQPSVVAGAGASKIRITLMELERDEAVTEAVLPIPV